MSRTPPTLALLGPLVALLLGVGAAHAAPRLAFEPAALDLDGRGEATVRLVNRGTSPLQIRGVTAVGGWLGVQPTPARALAPGEALEVKVSSRADGPAQRFGALQVRCDDPSWPAAAVTGGGVGSRVAGLPVRANRSHLLSLLVFVPLLGALAILLLPAPLVPLSRGLALLTALVPLGLAAKVLVLFDRTRSVAEGSNGLQLVEHAVWIPGFHIEYHLGIDGISVALVALTALVAFIALLASAPILEKRRAYYALFLFLETGMLGTFCALDFFLFYVFWEVMLLPMYFLIGLWGGPRREYAAIKFFLYTLVGSVLMLLGVLALYYHSQPTLLVDGTPAAHTFDMLKLAHENDFTRAAPLLGFDLARLTWILFFIGFAVKVPVVPLHTWLPDAHVEAPTAVSVILAGVLLKMGTYGLLRVNLAILPGATRWAAGVLALLGVINIVYGALCAFAQTDLKRLVAYSSVSHMGYCLLGIAALTEPGLQGAMLQMINHGTITAMLFLCVGVLYDRAHSRELDRFGGVAGVMPRYAAVFGLAFMASLGLPGLSGFVGEALVLLGAFPGHHALVGWASLGVVLTAAYHLLAIEKVQLGPWNGRAWPDRSAFPDLSAREWATLAPLALLVIVLGVYPGPLLDLGRTSLVELLRHVTAGGMAP